jgi:antitoxin HicB
MNQLNYSILIQWSDDDQCYVVTLPEFADRVMQPCNDGVTYEEALRNGQSTLENLIDFYGQEGWTLPQPQKLQPA